MTFDRWSSGGTWGGSWGGDVCRPPRRPRPSATLAYEIYTAQEVVDHRLLSEPGMLDLVRTKLGDRTQHWAEHHGYQIVEVHLSTVPPDPDTRLAKVCLEARIVPRTDGEWAAIRQAIQEDQLDRAAAEDSKHTVDDRLDALRAAVAAWSAPSPRAAREALRGPLERFDR